MKAPALQLLINASVAPDVHLRDPQPLTLTRNFGWVVGMCMASLLLVPLAIGWMASLVLN